MLLWRRLLLLLLPHGRPEGRRGCEVRRRAHLRRGTGRTTRGDTPRHRRAASTSCASGEACAGAAGKAAGRGARGVCAVRRTRSCTDKRARREASRPATQRRARQRHARLRKHLLNNLLRRCERRSRARHALRLHLLQVAARCGRAAERARSRPRERTRRSGKLRLELAALLRLAVSARRPRLHLCECREVRPNRRKAFAIPRRDAVYE
jgi:hypothetical protein